jgi:preprotein translocase subunit SecG
LHAAKGEGLGGIGGQARVFGTQKGLEKGLNRVTTFFAISFIALSLLLSMLITK